MKRILMVVAAVGALTLGGLMTSTADAHWGGPARCYPHSYGYAQAYPYRAGYRVNTPNLYFSTPSFGIGVGAGYGYTTPYPVYSNPGYFGYNTGYFGW